MGCEMAATHTSRALVLGEAGDHQKPKPDRLPLAPQAIYLYPSPALA